MSIQSTEEDHDEEGGCVCVWGGGGGGGGEEERLEVLTLSKKLLQNQFHIQNSQSCQRNSAVNPMTCHNIFIS